MVLLVIAAAAHAGGHDLAVIHPGGVPASQDEQDNANKLILQIAQISGWIEDSGKAMYFTDEAKGLNYIKSDKPAFVLTTPGFYLQHRDELNLKPIDTILVDHKSATRFYVMVKKGSASSLDALAGKTLAGEPLAELRYIEKVVLKGKVDFSKSKIKPMPFFKALKALKDGAAAAIVVDEKQHKSLAGLSFASQFETLFSSDPVPVMSIMAVGENASQGDVKDLRKACENFCSTEEGRDVCLIYGITGFAPVTDADYKAVADLWEQ